MSTVLGPVLGFRGTDGATWNVSVLLVVEEGDGPTLTWWTADDATRRRAGVPALIHQHSAYRVMRFEVPVPLRDTAQQVFYRVAEGDEFDFWVPKAGQTPSLAYASCNGFSNPRDMKKVGDKNERWNHLARTHAAQPVHLLLLGGDQVYSDSLWEIVPVFKRWAKLRQKKRQQAPFTPEMKGAAEEFFFGLYRERWKQPEPRKMLARVPSIMMWDDHDIFDGWGSYPEKDQACLVYQGIFAVARSLFRVFQLQCAEGETHPATLPDQPGFTQCFHLGDIALAALDMRSERTQDRVLGDASWTAFYSRLDALKGRTHLLVMSSIPVVHPDFGIIERLLGAFPGQQQLEDDLKDHWHSQSHKVERLRLIHRLLDYSRRSRCRVTLLSGDVHVGAVGVIESRRALPEHENAQVINQLTSSGIVHPAPPGMMLHFLESVADKVEEVDRGITARMLEFPGTRNRFIGTRNWLALHYDDKRRVWANWHISGAPRPFTKVIHPCENGQDVEARPPDAARAAGGKI